MDRSNSPLSYEDFVATGLLELVANLASSSDIARVLLDRIGFPPGSIPAFDEPDAFWRKVGLKISQGVARGGLAGLLQQLATVYRYNAALAPWRVGMDEAAPPLARTPAGRFAPDRPFSILLLGASPSGYPGISVQAELDVVKREMQGNARLRPFLDVTLDQVTRILLEEQGDLVHFACHGVENGLLLESDQELGVCLLNVDGLLKWWAQVSPWLPQCLVLNSCSAGQFGPAEIGHIPWVVVNRGATNNFSALAYSRGFYRALHGQLRDGRAPDFRAAHAGGLGEQQIVAKNSTLVIGNSTLYRHGMPVGQAG